MQDLPEIRMRLLLHWIWSGAIRIADTIARSPDKPRKKKEKETKIAFWEDGNIYIEPLDKDVMGDIRL